MTAPAGRAVQTWPSLRVEDWTATRDTLHMWTQIVGKIRLAQVQACSSWPDPLKSAHIRKRAVVSQDDRRPERGLR